MRCIIYSPSEEKEKDRIKIIDYGERNNLKEYSEKKNFAGKMIYKIYSNSKFIIKRNIALKFIQCFVELNFVELLKVVINNKEV